MRKFNKIIIASIVFAGCSTTAFAGAQDTAFKPQAMKIKTSTSATYATTKKIVRMNDRLPQASQVATQSTKTILFFNAQPTRSKVVRLEATKTNTPNVFKR